MGTAAPAQMGIADKVAAAVGAALVLTVIATATPGGAAAGFEPSGARIGQGRDVVTSAVALSETTFIDEEAEIVAIGARRRVPRQHASTFEAIDTVDVPAVSFAYPSALFNGP